MKKKLLSLSLAAFFSVASLSTAFAGNEVPMSTSQLKTPSIIIDGKYIDSREMTPFVDETSRVMWPLRLVTESLGAMVTWDESKNCVVIDSSNGKITLVPDSDTVTINGNTKKLGYFVNTRNSRLWVPSSFFSEILGVKVQLDSSTQTINIQKPSKSLETVVLSDSEEKARETLASYLTSMELNRNFSGQILVEKDGKVLIDRPYGYANYENKIKPLNTTTFGIGSVTKQFTAACIAQLVEKGKLSYDDKVSKYLSDAPFGDKITIHQILTHTSGLTEYTKYLDIYLTGEKIKPSELTYDKLISLIKDKPLDFEPGSKWSYSNTGYLLLGEIVEKVSGQSLEDYMKENIFKAAGMENTGISYKAEEKLVGAKGYVGYMDVVPEQDDVYLLNAAYGAGFLCSTAEDIYKWDMALQDGKIVSKESLSKIFGKHADTKLMGYYGYGWFIESTDYGEEITHGGNSLGFTADNAIFTDKNAHVVILTNKQYANLNGIKENIMKAVDGKNVSPVKERGVYDISNSELEKYAGKFKTQDIEAGVVNNTGVLMLNIQGVTVKLTAESKEKFYSRDMDVDVEFVLNEQGNAKNLIIKIPGNKEIKLDRAADTKYIKVSDEQLKKYEGTYEIKGLIKISIAVKDGKLISQGEGQPSFEVMALSETEFESLLIGIKIKFDSKENPTEFTLYQAGQEFKAVKIK